MKQFKTFLIVQKFRPFLDKRLGPVGLLWCGVLLIYELVSGGIGYFVDKDSSTTLKLINMASFGDWHVVAILAVGIVTVMGLLTIIQLNIHTNSLDRVRIERFIKRLWDEVSSAATHAGAALFASMYWRESAVSSALYREQLTTAAALLLIAFLSFHFEGSGVEALAPDSEAGNPPEKDVA